MGRKPIPAEKRAIRKVISLSPSLCKSLEDASARTGMPQSVIIRRLLSTYLYEITRELKSDDTTTKQ